MSGLINDLMDFARTRLGSGLSLQISDGSGLAAALEATVGEIRAAHPGLDITTRIDLPRNVSCDIGRISQLCSNLLANAVPHGEAGGLIEFVAESGEFGWLISVRNRGETIKEMVLAPTFDPFIR